MPGAGHVSLDEGIKQYYILKILSQGVKERRNLNL